MKKFLLSAAALMLATVAYAQLEGSYNVTKYHAYEIGSNYKFNSGEESSSDDEGFEPWTVTIEKTDAGYVISNLFDWYYSDEEGTYIDQEEATFDAETGVMTLGNLTDDYEGYGTLGKLGTKYVTAEEIMNRCDECGSYVDGGNGYSPATFRLEDNQLANETPILIYTMDDAYFASYGYIGYSYMMYSELVLEKKSSSVLNIDTEEVAPAQYFNLQGTRINAPEKGQIVIVRKGNKTTKIIY